MVGGGDGGGWWVVGGGDKPGGTCGRRGSAPWPGRGRLRGPNCEPLLVSPPIVISMKEGREEGHQGGCLEGREGELEDRMTYR